MKEVLVTRFSKPQLKPLTKYKYIIILTLIRCGMPDHHPTKFHNMTNFPYNYGFMVTFAGIFTD